MKFDRSVQPFVFLFAETVIILSNKESGLKGPGFGLPSEGASILFPPCGSLLERWSGGVMKGPIRAKFGVSFLPTLQYSSTPKQVASVQAKPLNSDLAP